ncbi:MAG: hypothetical protein WAL29_08280 [Bacteroidales bacterium]
MKKLFFLLIASAGFTFPLFAQVDHVLDESEAMPVETLILKKDQVPPAIINAVNSDFRNGEAFKWGKFPFTLEKYAWVVDKDAGNAKPDYYEVFIKAHDGSDIYAVYTPDGTIKQSRTIRKNAALLPSVMQSLAKSQYKDWTVVGDKEIIKYYNTKNDIEEHVKVTVEKNNVKKNLSFNYKEPVGQS